MASSHDRVRRRYKGVNVPLESYGNQRVVCAYIDFICKYEYNVKIDLVKRKILQVTFSVAYINFQLHVN